MSQWTLLAYAYWDGNRHMPFRLRDLEEKGWPSAAREAPIQVNWLPLIYHTVYYQS